MESWNRFPDPNSHGRLAVPDGSVIVMQRSIPNAANLQHVIPHSARQLERSGVLVDFNNLENHKVGIERHGLSILPDPSDYPRFSTRW